MKRLEIEEAAVMTVAVRQEIERHSEARYDHRLHAVLLACIGWSCTRVAALFGHSARTVHSWVRRFVKHGFAGLQEREGRGRPSVVSANVRRRIARDLRRHPRKLGYEQNLWDGRLLSRHLHEQYDVRMGVRQCQRLFHALGFRRRKPRPVIAHGDPKLQAAYKKTPPPRAAHGHRPVVRG
jgi:transposase